MIGPQSYHQINDTLTKLENPDMELFRFQKEVIGDLDHSEANVDFLLSILCILRICPETDLRGSFLYFWGTFLL